MPSPIEYVTDPIVFTPDPARAKMISRHMRQRLARSFRHIVERSRGTVAVPEADIERRIAEIETAGLVSPNAFALYHDLLSAIQIHDLERVETLFDELARCGFTQNGLIVADYCDENGGYGRFARYRRYYYSDPTSLLALLPPPSDLAKTARGQIKRALALLEDAAPELAGEIAQLVAEIVLAVRQPGSSDFEGATAFPLWGGVLLNVGEQKDAFELAQTLAHESAHGFLFAHAIEEPLVRNPYEERYPSPLREDPRPMDGNFHAIFVVARMHYAVSRILEADVLSGEDRERARADRALHAESFAKGIAVLDAHADLSETGSCLIAGARDYMAGT